MKKGVLGLTLALSMAVANPTGCGGGGTTETTTVAAGDMTTAVAVETTTAAAAAGDTVLKWVVWDINPASYTCL